MNQVLRMRLSRKTRILASGLALLLLAYTAVGFLLVPRLVRSQLLEFSARNYQREFTVGGIAFNPFTLALQVHGFSFADAQGAPMLAFDRLLLDFDVNSAWRRGPSFAAIELDAPAGRIVMRADGTLNLTELSAPFEQPAGSSSDSDESARVFVDRLKIQDGALDFEDQARATPFKARLTPVNFELLDFSTMEGSANQYVLQAVSSAGERFRWSGSFGLDPLSSRGEFELDDVQARTLWSYLQESLGFEIASGVADVRGNYHVATTEPLTANVTLSKIDVSNLGIRPRGGAEDSIHVDALALSGARIDAAGRVVDIAAIEVAGGRLLVNRATDGAVDVLALMGPAQGELAAPAGPAGDSSSPWTVNLPEIGARDLRIEVNDAFVKPAARLIAAPVNVTMRGFSTAPGAAMDLDANLTLESGGRFALRGKAQPADQAFEGKVSLEALNLAALQPYAGTYTQMTLLSGLLSAELDTTIDTAGLRLQGNVESSKLHTIDNALREDFIKWERLALQGLSFRSPAGSKPGSLQIANISARSPYVRFIIAPDQSTNVGKVLTMPASAPGPVQTVRNIPADAAGTPLPMDIRIGRVEIQNGSANFADFWITPNYAVSLQQLGGSVSGLSSSKDSRAKLALTGKIDRYAPVEIGGELNLLSASLFTDLRVKFDGVDLTSVTPYSGRFAGYRIEKGKLSVDVRYQVEDRKLNAEQRFVVDQLTLGERVDSPDAVKLPLRLAVALLKDRNGVIDLGLPVTGSLDDPKFRLGPIVWKAFVNLLAGVATSPFKLLGSVFGGGEEVNLIDFDPGSATLDGAAAEKLTALTRALRERPQLALDVPAIYSGDADLATLAARQLDEKLQALARGPIEDPARRFELLLALYRADRPGAALPPQAQTLQTLRAREREPAALDAANHELETALRPGIDGLQPALLALAEQRARNIQDALLASGEVESARVFLVAPSAHPANGEKVRVALSLK